MYQDEIINAGFGPRPGDQPMRGSKQIQSDIRRGARRGFGRTGGGLPLYPAFHRAGDPSYR